MTLAETLPLFIRPDEPVELRFLGVERPGRVHAGWITTAGIPAVASKVAALAARSEGVYFTPQRLKPDVLSRAPRGHFGNVVRLKGKGNETRPKLTHDADVAERRYLLIDVDPIRATGFEKHSATDSEREAAFAVAAAVRSYLVGHGWAAPIVVDSGNGVHHYYRLPGLIAGDAAFSDGEDQVAVLLRCLAARFGTLQAEIDVRVGNPARIMKLAGSWSRKGPDAKDRPHRQSRIVEVPNDWNPN